MRLAAQDNEPQCAVVISSLSPPIRAPQIVNMPIFPLNVVALPAVTVPLHIFEPRYRVLFNTIMSGTEGVDEVPVVLFCYVWFLWRPLP